MPNFYGAYLYIPKIGGKIILPPKEKEIHIGRQDIKNSATKTIDEQISLDVISGKRKDQNGAFKKEQFIIYLENDDYYIEDKRSSNGTYIGKNNLKGKGKRKLHPQDEIILPIQKQGKLMQLKLYFYLAENPQNIQQGSDQNYGTPQYKKSAVDNSEDNEEAKYIDPDEMRKIPLAKNKRPNAIYQDPENQSSSSFIVVEEKIPIPKNAFSKNSGLDFSWVFKLEKEETWHIGYAFFLLFIMVYHTAINLRLIELIFLDATFDPIVFFVDPIPLAILFGISFIIHELSHLNMGKHCGYQSRFCLTKDGVKATKRAAYIGIPFGLPGAAVSVGVDPEKDNDDMGKIKVAGPSSNLIFGVLIFIITLLIPGNSNAAFKFKIYLVQGASLNFVLGAFNLIPIKVKGYALDGENIIKWNKKLYLILAILLILGIVGTILFTNNIYNEYNIWLASRY